MGEQLGISKMTSRTLLLARASVRLMIFGGWDEMRSN